jgi:hypothetical protein
MTRANIVPISRPDQQLPDSSFAAMSGTEWKSNKPCDPQYSRVPWGPSICFDIHLAQDDSITIYYSNLGGTIIGEPFNIFLHKGSYTYTPDVFGFQTGVYLHTCVIGHKKRSAKIVIMR